MRVRFLQHAQHQAGVVRLRILVADAAFQAVVRRIRHQRTERFAAEVVAGALAGHAVINGEPQQERAPARLAAGIVAEREALRLHQSRRLAQQAFAFAHRLARQCEAAFLQVAQPAVHQLR